MNKMEHDNSLLKDKVAIITSAATENGIGNATAKLFAQHKCNVAILDLEQANPEQAAKQLEETYGNKHCGIVCDITKHGQCKDAVERVVQDLGTVNILVNNAGVSLPHRIHEITDAEYDKVMDSSRAFKFLVCPISITMYAKK